MKTIHDKNFVERTAYFSSGIQDRFTEIDWREGDVFSIFLEQNQQSFKKDIYVIFSGEFYSINFVLIARGIIKIDYHLCGPDSISNAIYSYDSENKTEKVRLEGYSDGYMEVEAESLLLFELKTPITNPYQTLVDLDLINQ